MSKNLRQFLDMAKRAGSDCYVEVKKPLAVDLEMSILQRKLAKEGRYPVIYCSQMKGSKLPYCSNLFGSYELLGLALDIEPESLKKIGKGEIQQEYMKRLNNPRPVQWVSTAESPVKDIVIKGKDVDLGMLPIPKGSELDSGKYISIGSLICKDADKGIPNVGVYRHEVKAKNKIGAEIAVMHHGAYIARHYAELNKMMEVVLIIGHHPAFSFGALTTGSLEADELEAAGGFLGEPLRVTKAETVDIPIPADAEIVIEGIIDTTKMATDGPYAEWAGYYGGQKSCYLIEVTCITMRHDAIYHGLDSGHREHNLAQALAHEACVYDTVKTRVPTVKAVHCPPSGRCNLHYYVSIAKHAQGEGMIAGLLALGAEMNIKLAVVVDEDVDVFDEEEVLWAVATRVSWDRDIAITPRVAQWPSDPSTYSEKGLEYDSKTPRGAMVGKAIIDATKPVTVPFATRITSSKDIWDAIKLEEYV